MTPDAWADFVRDRCGMTFAGGRGRVLARCVADRVAATAARSDDDYFVRAAADPAEWGRLFELLLNGETRFFRDPAVIAAVTRGVFAEVRRRRPGGPRVLNVWSAGCSTGQEPYSLAAAWHETGPARGWDLRILATDANPAALAKAGRGVYRDFEAKSLPDPIRAKYGRAAGSGWEVGPTPRAAVTFRLLDLTAGGYAVPPQDAIVCQNVLIYYAAAARAAVVGRLAASLAPGGFLFLGPTDAVGLKTPGLTPTRFADTWAYQRHAETDP